MLKIGSSNLSVLQKGLLMQDWVLRLEFERKIRNSHFDPRIIYKNKKLTWRQIVKIEVTTNCCKGKFFFCFKSVLTKQVKLGLSFGHKRSNKIILAFVLGTIHILRQHICGTFLIHPPTKLA